MTPGQKIAYGAHPAEIVEGKTFLLTETGKVEIPIFGHHNLQNLLGALEVCLSLGLTKSQFYTAISSFKGAAKRQRNLGKWAKQHSFPRLCTCAIQT